MSHYQNRCYWPTPRATPRQRFRAILFRLVAGLVIIASVVQFLIRISHHPEVWFPLVHLLMQAVAIGICIAAPVLVIAILVRGAISLMDQEIRR